MKLLTSIIEYNDNRAVGEKKLSIKQLRRPNIVYLGAEAVVTCGFVMATTSRRPGPQGLPQAPVGSGATLWVSSAVIASGWPRRPAFLVIAIAMAALTWGVAIDVPS